MAPKLTDEQAAVARYEWRLLWARDDQVMPEGDDWSAWAILSGRGWGKTRTGAQAVQEWAERGEGPIALVGATAADVRDVMVEGVAGIMAVAPPWFKPNYEPSKRRLTWPNGVFASTFSAEEPDRLRGPQFAKAWCDELAAWERLQETWDMLSFGLRLGHNPQRIVTTTPRPLKIIRDLMADARTVVTRGRTRDNYANLAGEFIRQIEAKYGGTRLGRQELDGELLDDIPGALWTLENIAENRRSAAPDSLARVCVAIDPPVTSGENADECGIVCAASTGNDIDAHAFVLEDDTSQGETPDQWAKRAVRLYHKHKADRIVAEVNNGGELIAGVIRHQDPNVPVTMVRATRGKVVRAEPVAALYEQNRVHHIGAPERFTKLEDQMRQITTDFDKDKAGFSPDRVDALVWALTHLMLDPMELAPRMIAL